MLSEHRDTIAAQTRPREPSLDDIASSQIRAASAVPPISLGTPKDTVAKALRALADHPPRV